MTKTDGKFIGASPGMSAIKEDDLYESDDLNAGSSVVQSQFQSKIGKHYEVPNMSSMLYEFTNKEQDRVH